MSSTEDDEQDNRQKLEHHRQCFHIVDRVILAVYTPLLVLSNASWLHGTLALEENWDCASWRSPDDDPSLASRFLYYSVWSLWLTTATFTTWAVSIGACCCRQQSKRRRAFVAAKTIYMVALPWVCTVCISDLYYVAKKPVDKWINTEQCYHMGRSSLNKDYAPSNMDLVNLILLFKVIEDVTMHYLSPPLFLYYYVTGHVSYEACWIPWSTLFCVALSVIIVPVQLLDGPIYNGDIWFNVGMVCLINLVFHVIYALISRGKLGCRQGGCILPVAGTAPAHEENEQSSGDRGQEEDNQDEDNQQRENPPQGTVGGDGAS